MTDTELFTNELQNNFTAFTNTLMAKISALSLNIDKDVVCINKAHADLVDTRAKLIAIKDCSTTFAASMQELANICLGAENRCDDILRAMKELIETNVITKE